MRWRFKTLKGQSEDTEAKKGKSNFSQDAQDE